MNNSATATIPEVGSGYLEISEKGFGFLRSPENFYAPNRRTYLLRPTQLRKIFYGRVRL
jgi:transcription termination factor Rho